MAEFKNYDPLRYVVIFKGVQIRGYASGTFVNIERAEDSFTEDVGSGGDVVRVRSHNKSGTCTLTLQAASPSNDQLSAILAADEAGVTVDAGVGALLVKDLNGTTVASASSAWIRKPPAVEQGNEATNREWVIACANLKLFVGGAIR
jgi:hypothetical protein